MKSLIEEKMAKAQVIEGNDGPLDDREIRTLKKLVKGAKTKRRMMAQDIRTLAMRALDNEQWAAYRPFKEKMADLEWDEETYSPRQIYRQFT